MTREEVRAETNRIVDEAIKQGNDAGMDPFEIGLVNTSFRAFVHMLDDAQALDLDPDGVRSCIVSHMANIIKVFMQRTIAKDDTFSAQFVGNDILQELGKFMAADLNEWFKANKPH